MVQPHVEEEEREREREEGQMARERSPAIEGERGRLSLSLLQGLGGTERERE
jgi:hypothetical protein